MKARTSRWVGGNRFRLLENGEEFYPAVFDAISRAEREVQLETFIWFDDKVGRALQAVLMEAARRGVQIDVTLDDYGSPDLPQEFLDALGAAGVRVHVFDPGPRIFGRRIQMLRRLHRKLVVVDGRVAFVGGINYSADHLGDFGPEAKQDYAVEAHGPIVQEIHRFALKALAPVLWRPRWWPHRRAVVATTGAPLPSEGEGEALLVTRDNNEHRNDIERHYRVALRAARHEVIIANAYFFPGYRFIKELRRAARRGVQVKLILQGEPDMAIVRFAARLLYDTLQAAGVTIYEYCKRPMHGKIALVDDQWATVGSSNLDPLSLSLNLEANLVIRDSRFNEEVRRRLEGLIDQHCRCIEVGQHRGPTWWNSLVTTVVFHVTRNFASWAAALPRHAPRLWSVPPPRPPEGQGTDALARRAAG